MELSKIRFYSTTVDWIQTIKVDLEKNKIYVDGREGGNTEKGSEPGLINDKRETSNQSIKLSSTHAVWVGRIWWVISIDKDKQCSTGWSLNLCLSQGPDKRGAGYDVYHRVPGELDTQMVASAIYPSDSTLQLVVCKLKQTQRQWEG